MWSHSLYVQLTSLSIKKNNSIYRVDNFFVRKVIIFFAYLHLLIILDEFGHNTSDLMCALILEHQSIS